MPGAADNRILDPNGEDGPKSTTKPIFFCVLFQTMVVPVVLGVRPDAAQQHTQAHHESRMNKGSPLTLHTTDLQRAIIFAGEECLLAFLPCLGFQSSVSR